MSAGVFLVAAEASGDALGADLIEALRGEQPNVRLFGVGGEKMAARGVASQIDIGGLAVLGLIDGVKAFGRVKRKVQEVAEAVAKADPDAVVLIDSWGFMWRLARELKLRGVRARRIKLIGPQVWATRAGRARILAKWCDHLLCIHAFEQPFYERWGLPTTVIGNPALGRMRKGDGATFRKSRELSADETVIGLLPGSRPSEIRRVAPTLIEACRRLCREAPNRTVACVVAPPIETELRALSANWQFPHVLVTGEGSKSDAFAAMDIALACSGTVTTELAAQGPAIIVGYRLGWVTWVIARVFLMRARFITLLNVAADREVAPEFVQTRFTATNLARAAEHLLSNPDALARQRKDQGEALKKMAGPERPAASIAAETVLWLAAQ